MPDPKKPWEKNYSEDIVETKVEAKKPWEQEYDVSESEKKKSTPTTTPPKSVSGTPTGSSGGVNPAFKNTIPSPIPDFNNLPKSKEVPIKVGGETSFLEDVVSTVKSKANKLATGSSQLGADIAAIPELLYDTAAIPQNAIADYFDLPNLHADSDKFKKNIGIRNAVKELYQGEVVKLREHAKQVDTKYQDGIYDSFKNGDLLGGFDQITNSFVESLPATASIMLGGAYAKAPQLLTASTMVFGSGKNERLKDENPEMNTNARTINALGTGFAEGTFETMGSGSIGAAARGLIERQGAAKATTILKDGLVKSYKYALSKNPFTASLAVEGVEEWATQVTQNSIDVATGVKPKDFNVFDGAADAFIGGAFGGAVFGGGLKGIEQMTNLQDRNAIKTNIKNTQELQKALENPDISEETKLQIEKTIEGLVKTNQQLIIKNTKHADNLHPKLKEQLVESVTKIEETKQAVKSIKLDGTTNDAQKQILLDGLKEDFKKHIKLKADILEGKSTPVDVLPLKEQDKIKRQALKELTTEQNPDGTKSIEIDNAQILERANKIYKENEQTPPTPEAQLQAEVPQQAEAEKVAPPPVEDVVATSVEKPSDEQQLEDVKNGDIVSFTYGDKSEIPEIFKDKISSEGEINGKKEIKVTIAKSLAEYHLQNEKSPETNTPTNGNVQLGASNVGESGTTEQENTAKKSVPSSVDGGEVKGDASVGENNNSWDKEFQRAKSENDLKALDVLYDKVKVMLNGIAQKKGEETVRYFQNLKNEIKNYSVELKKTVETLQPKSKGDVEVSDFAEFEKVVNESKTADEAFDKIKNIKGVSSETSKSFREKYDPKGDLSIKEAFGKFYDEVKAKTVETAQVENKQKPTTKERIAERIKLSDAKIDEKSDAVKAKLKAFADMFPSADINPDDYKTNGFSTDAIIDMVAKAAKSLMEAGIRMDEAIKQAIEGYNTHFDDKIDPKVIEENIRKEATDNEKSNPKKEADNDFKREKGKSSVLKRIREGGNSSEINDIIDKIGLNYEGRKQEQVYADGVNFVKEVGIAEAYNAIKNGELKDSDTINVVYATILQEFPKMAENEISKVSDPQELSDLVKELDDFHEKIYTEFKTRTIDAGRGSAILNFIYNQDLKIRYSLSQQIENFKKVNNGVVSPEALAKMKELDKQYQEANKRIEELEGLLKEAQEQKDFENIVEEEKRQPKLSKTKREKAEKIIKALDDFEKSILKNSYSDATMITPIIVQGIRATKLAIKQGVNIAEAIEKGIDGIKKELEKLGKTFDNEERFRNDLNKSLEGIDVELQQPKVTVDKNGKVRIPTEMIKDYISKGGTDLSEFATQVQESIKDEFPDVSVRDIRESVSNYGKKVNKSRPKIVEDIQKLKSEERLRLEYEDLQKRISKEKNEVKKRALTQTQKRLKEQIKQLQDDLGITETERTNRSVNYTKKRIEILREKIKNNDFAKKEIKPIVESQELKEAKIEKNRVQEEFDYLSYKQEFDNRTFEDKALQLGSDLWDAQRLTLATGEASFVGAQGGLYMVDATFSRKTLKNLVENFKGTTAKEWKSNPFGTALKMIKSASSAGAIIKMVNTMGTANNYIDSQRLLKESPDYDLYLKMGIRLLGEDVKTQVQDDNFIGNNILTLLKLPINFIDRVEKADLKNFKITLAETEKKRTTLQGYYEKLKTGKVSDKNKKTATEIFSNANPLATFERGNNTFMNFARKDLADIYIAELRAQGKNPIDHLDDFKKVGSAINTITGSGNLNQTVTMALPILNKTMFSARYFAASWNLTPPMSLYYLAKLGNYDGMEINKPGTWKTWKPTVAQKAFVKPMMKGFLAMYGVSLATMALINAAIDDDDEMTEEEKAKKRAYIEYDPRSSNFMQVNSGNTHTDFFGPYRGNVVFMSKILSGQSKNREGKIIENGSEYGSRTDFQIGAEYLAGKANPTLGVPLRYWQGSFKDVVNEETGEKERKRMLFNDEVGIGYQIKHNTYPIFIKTVKAISDEDPVLGSAFYNTLAFFGKNTNVYKTPKAATPEQEFLKDQEKKKSLYKLPENEKVKIRVDRKLTRVESDVKLLQNLQTAQQKGLPYFISMDAALTKQQVKDMDLSGTDESVARIKQIVSEVKAQYGIEDEE